MQHCWRGQSTFFCLPRPSPRAPSLCLSPDQVDEGSRLHLHPRRKTRGLAWDNDHSRPTTILQPKTKALALQAPPTKSGRDFFSLSILVLRARVTAALAALRAKLWSCCNSTQVRAAALSSKLYASASAVPYKWPTFAPIPCDVVAYQR